MNHEPVLITRIIEDLKSGYQKEGVARERKFLDLTFGAGGYSRSLLSEFLSSEIFCFDQDPITLKYFSKVFDDFGDRAHFFLENFSNASNKLIDLGVSFGFFDAIFFDLGVSSMQLDDKTRGFSFFGENNILDMRMNNDESFGIKSAYEFLNFASEKEIADVIYYYGNENCARKIAKNIVRKRESNGQIKTTKELSDLVLKVIPFKKNKPKDCYQIHPATKTFQAIRMHVNKELDHLIESIQDIVKFLKPNGKLFIVTFHSIEDRIIKNFFLYMQNGVSSSSEIKIHFPRIFQNEKEFFDDFKFQVNKNIITSSDDEVAKNVRSRSAKMRILQRI